uniref:bifunctional tetrahydrofolate synthase/dihydrofolate synthase n=1 Tax=Ningiella ruwaisensis TaxID=2364274 RepID=UPI0010A04490|nr:bifunctional tetrahydrofolate synthase/dihydrofolate synthase [Ningiella ruwaisensis]
MKNLAAWLAYIEASHSIDIDMGLERVRLIAQRMQLNFEQAVVITVAGTNGKGTTCRLLEQICLQAGFSVGVYSSPHILKFNERIRVNNTSESDLNICKAFKQIKHACEASAAYPSISLTYFEYATLAAMHIFKEKALDIIILEVGLGGRLDATNIIDADVNIITSIGLDHQDYLGSSLEQIAYEKCGIVKQNKRSVIAYTERYAKAEAHIDGQQNRVYRRGVDFDFVEAPSKNRDECYAARFSLPLDTPVKQHFEYHWAGSAIPPQNVMGAIAGAWHIWHCIKERAQEYSHLNPNPSNQRLKANQQLFNLLTAAPQDEADISKVIASTSLFGRAQIVSNSPCIILDVAHNQAAAEYLANKLATIAHKRCHMVIGMLKDKNIEATIQSLSGIATNWYCASLPGKRGELSSRLVNAVKTQTQAPCEAFDDISAALQSALEQASNADMIVVMGSFVSVAQAYEALSLTLD